MYYYCNKKAAVILSLKWVLLSLVTTVNSHHQKGHHGFEPKLDLVPGEEIIQNNIITYFMYNITNPDEFEAGEKPVFVEVGPYVYKETRRKFNIEKVSESVMKYSLDRYWKFMPELSQGHLETDEFNVINIPMLILANKLSSKRLPKAFNDILVEELTDKGDSLVRRNEEIGDVIYHGMNVSIYTEILSDVLQGNVPPEFLNGKFALFKGQNGTKEGTFTVRSKGAKTGDILTFNNKTKLEYWGGDFCNKIDGTDGYFFRPDINEKSILKIFYPELCRSVYLKWQQQMEYEGITVEKFSFPEDMLEDPAIKSENVCFCSKPIVPSNNSMDYCLKRGFIDYASCKQGSPLLISFPHFLYADKQYRDELIGLNPIPKKHESVFLVEPKTGTIVSGTRKFQFNVKLRPLDNVEFFRNSTFMIIPVFNTERGMIVPKSRIDKLKEDLKKLDEAKNDKDLYHVHDHDSVDENNLPESQSRAESEPEPTAENEALNNSHKSKSNNGFNCFSNSQLWLLSMSLVISSLAALEI